VTKKGAAVGRIHGVNHLALIVDDMDASVRFYRDGLGFEVVRTVSLSANATESLKVTKTYFFDIGSSDGMLLALFEVVRDSSLADAGREPALADVLWPTEAYSLSNPRKMDHLAFNVETHDDLVFFQAHLRSQEIVVSEITSRVKQEFVESIYFYDPNRIPIEIATFDWQSPRWNDIRGVKGRPGWLQDPDPVPALLEEDR
jgi:catechol 2,3-dioxygenase-like lactoylglutathione lyase family enzyme